MALPFPPRPGLTSAALVLQLRVSVIRHADILVADDDETSVRSLRRLLSREGHHVWVVSTVEQALEACARDAPDLVLVDLVAPRGHGFDLCRRLKNQSVTRFVPVVIVTAQSDRRDRLKRSEERRVGKECA